MGDSISEADLWGDEMNPSIGRTFRGYEIRLDQPQADDSSSFQLGHVLWEAAEVLADVLPDSLEGKSILELGKRIYYKLN